MSRTSSAPVPLASVPDRPALPGAAAAGLPRVRETRPRRRSLRAATALMLVVAAVAHIPVTPEHLHEAPYIGALFLALTIVCFLLAAAVVLPGGDHPALWALSGTVCTAAVGAYLLSRSVALPQIGDDVGNWTEPLGLVSIASEALVTALAAIALSHPARRAVHSTPA